MSLRYGARSRVSRQVSGWVQSVDAKAGQAIVIPYSSDFLSALPVNSNTGVRPAAVPVADTNAHTFGAWTQITASLPDTISGLFLSCDARTSGVATGTVIEVGVGASGSETTVAQIAIGSHSYNGGGYLQLIPLGVQAGQRIAVRIQSVVTGGKTVTVSYGFMPQIAGFGSFPAVDTYGVSLATSLGTNVPSANTWIEVASSTTRDYRGLVMVWSASNATMSTLNILGQLATGASGSETRIAYQRFASGSTEDIISYQSVPPFLYVGHVPAGTRLSVQHNAAVSFLDACILGIPYA